LSIIGKLDKGLTSCVWLWWLQWSSSKLDCQGKSFWILGLLCCNVCAH